MSADPGWAEIEQRFDIDHPSTKGHFPGNPIIPGAVLIDSLIRAFTQHQEPLAGPIEIMHAKFLCPVRPGDLVIWRWQISGNTAKFDCRIVEQDRLALTGALRQGGRP